MSKAGNPIRYFNSFTGGDPSGGVLYVRFPLSLRNARPEGGAASTAASGRSAPVP
jgi:hypothetical protein